MRGWLTFLRAVAHEKFRSAELLATSCPSTAFDLNGQQSRRTLRLVLEAVSYDIRQALRHLRRSPGFAAAAIFILAFGIGANTALFSVLNALVLRPLPIRDPHGLIGVSGRGPAGEFRLTLIPAVDELTRNEGPLQHVCAYNGGVVLAVEANGIPSQAIGALVTGQCFEAFGVAPILGRPIVNADAPLLGKAEPVAVISHRFWTRMFGANLDAIGKRLRTVGVDLTVIGVLPPGFGGLHADAGVDVFAPFNSMLSPPSGDRPPGASHILGRLRPGITLEQAAARLSVLWPGLLEAVPASLPASERAELLDARPMVERIGMGLSPIRDRYARPLTIIMGLTSILLLLACVNLGGLLLARLAARGSELAVRVALGGSRQRIAQQMLLEGLALSLAGAALAVPLAFAFVVLLASLLPSGLVERTMTFTPDLRVLGATAIVGVSAGILTSALPIWISVRREASMQSMWDRTVAGSMRRWTRGLLVAEVALSVVMLVGSLLLVRSLYLLQRVDHGVRREGVLVVQVMPLPNAYRDIDNASYYPALLDELAALPGVRSVGFGRAFPRLSGVSPTQPIAFVGDPTGEVRAVLETVSPGFFETLGIPLVSGRLPSWTDNAKTPQVAVISESVASALALGGGVIGRRVRFGSNRIHQDVMLVGVVRDATMGNPRQPRVPVFYRPALQTGGFANYPNVVIAAEGNLSAVAERIRNVLQRAGREYAHDISTLDSLLTRAPATERMSATLAGAAALLAVALAFIGVHGLLAYMVSRRRREIGVRVAVGASAGAVLRMMLREGLVLTLVGLAIGLPAAWLSARVLRTLLFGVSEADTLTFGATAAFFLLLGIAAGLNPARRATAVDPVVALRAD
jgi:predicted permease